LNARTFCERGLASPSIHPLFKEMVGILIAAACGAGQALYSLLDILQLGDFPIFVGSADVPHPIESSGYDAESHIFHELSPLTSTISSTDDCFCLDPIPAFEAHQFLEGRQLDVSLPVFVIYIYCEVRITLPLQTNETECFH
jgi:hypothetical protein